MNLSHLQLMIQALDRVPDAALFSLRHWSAKCTPMNVVDVVPFETLCQSNSDRLAADDVAKLINECGTICCAAGWAIRDPAVNAAGLVADKHGSPRMRESELGGWAALSSFLECSYDTVHYLFDEDAYDTGSSTTLLDVYSRMTTLLLNEEAKVC